ncbi:UNVERIFIED_CONTAM: protein RETICULATA, chloroplastic [Sesamum calycinum]|uniref:Protein RETICULATA, chloroplastic n=1 Tax=Sesamum calycinum TaxID=2727403 RepID=A0AAW2NU74_9LAMI
MAGCSSSIRITHFKNLGNEVVLPRCFSSKSLAAAKFPCSGINGTRTNGHFLCKRIRRRLVIVNIMNPEAEPQSSVAATTITERGGGGGSGGGDNDGDDYEEKEFGPILKFEEVIRETEARGASLPADMLEAAKTVGLRKEQEMFLIHFYSRLELRFVKLVSVTLSNCKAHLVGECTCMKGLIHYKHLFQVSNQFTWFARMFRYLFMKSHSCCATFAEVKKRGKDFWAEFELYTADLLVGVVVNVALVGIELMLHFRAGILYGFVGFGCGIIGQGIANLIMTAKRSIKKSEDDIPVPPLIKSAALWGVFLAVSSNTRYQIINGLERLVEASPLAKKVPPVAMAFTVGVRFANNVYGGMQFVDWARLTGVQ